jgi:hypothetical protein
MSEEVTFRVRLVDDKTGEELYQGEWIHPLADADEVTVTLRIKDRPVRGGFHIPGHSSTFTVAPAR